MLNILVSFGRNGLQDWFWQRLSAVILAAYFIFVFYFVTTTPYIAFDEWYDLYDTDWMQAFSVLALVSLIIHAWIGMVTVITDYIKPVWLRITSHVFLILSLIIFLIWGIAIIWSI